MERPVQFTDESWTELTGADPEVRETRKTAALDRFAGTLAGTQFVVLNTPVRIDFAIQPLQSAIPEVPSFVAGKADELLSLLQTKIRAMSRLVGLPTRVALGGTLLLEAHDRMQAYRVLRDLLRSVSVDPERMSDLSYQVNWRVGPSDGLPALNRLTTWAAVLYRGMLATEAQPERSAVAFERHYVQFTFDMNSAPEGKEQLSDRGAEAVFAELFRLAEENMSEGEKLPS